MQQGEGNLETLLLRLIAATGDAALDQRKRVFNYARFTDNELVNRQVRKIESILLLRQFLGVGVSGSINRVVNARLAELEKA